MTVCVQAFSAIVGPNGSGKSNTIDALLFVFGFRATKMRQGKFSELIHNSGVAGGDNAAAAPVAVQDDADEDDEDGFFNPEEYDSEEEVEMRRRKGKGKGKKTARKAPSYAAAGGCDFATVEVWFREIIDSVSFASSRLSFLLPRLTILSRRAAHLARRLLGRPALATRRRPHGPPRQHDALHRQRQERDAGRGQAVAARQGHRLDSQQVLDPPGA